MSKSAFFQKTQNPQKRDLEKTFMST